MQVTDTTYPIDFKQGELSIYCEFCFSEDMDSRFEKCPEFRETQPDRFVARMGCLTMTGVDLRAAHPALQKTLLRAAMWGGDVYFEKPPKMTIAAWHVVKDMVKGFARTEIANQRNSICFFLQREEEHATC